MRRPRRSASSGSWVTSRTVRPASSRAARSCALWRVMASRLPNGLVHQHDRPVLHERADQRDALALPSGKRRRAGGEGLRQADLPQQQPRPVEVRPLAPQPRAEDRIVEDARPGEQQVVLAHIGHRRRPHPACGPAAQPCDQPQQAGLADAARPQQAGPDARFETDIQPVEQRNPAIGEGGPANIDGKPGFRCGPAHTLPPPVLTGSGPGVVPDAGPLSRVAAAPPSGAASMDGACGFGKALRGAALAASA